MIVECLWANYTSESPHVRADATQRFEPKLMFRYLSNPTGDRLRIALRNLVRAARRQKERGRQSRKSMGA